MDDFWSFITQPALCYIADKKEVKMYRYVLLKGYDEKEVERIEKLLSNDFDVHVSRPLGLSSGYRMENSSELNKIGIEVHERYHNFLKEVLGNYIFWNRCNLRTPSPSFTHNPQSYLFEENFAAALEHYWAKRCVRSLENEEGGRLMKNIEEKKYWSDYFRNRGYERDATANNAKTTFVGLYYSLFPEAFLVLEMYGAKKGLKIFEETIKKACRKGFNSGLKYFLSYMPEFEKQSVNMNNVFDDDFKSETYHRAGYTPEDVVKKVSSEIRKDQDNQAIA